MLDAQCPTIEEFEGASKVDGVGVVVGAVDAECLVGAVQVHGFELIGAGCDAGVVASRQARQM